MPAEAELKMPSTIKEVELFSSYTLEIPIPIAIPIGVVREKNVAIIAVALDLNLAYSYIQIMLDIATGDTLHMLTSQLI